MTKETRAKLLEIAEEMEALAFRVLPPGARGTQAVKFHADCRTYQDVAQFLLQHAGDQEEASSQSEGTPSPAEPPAPTCPDYRATVCPACGPGKVNLVHGFCRNCLRHWGVVEITIPRRPAQAKPQDKHDDEFVERMKNAFSPDPWHDREEASSEGAPSQPPAPTCPECGEKWKIPVQVGPSRWGCRNSWHYREEL